MQNINSISIPISRLFSVCLEQCLHSVLNVKVLVGTLNQDRAFSMSVNCEIFANLCLTFVSNSSLRPSPPWRISCPTLAWTPDYQHTCNKTSWVNKNSFRLSLCCLKSLCSHVHFEGVISGGQSRILRWGWISMRRRAMRQLNAPRLYPTFILGLWHLHGPGCSQCL